LLELAFFFQCVSSLIPSFGPSNTSVFQAAKDVHAGQDALFEVFERIEAFFQRLEIYSEAAAFNQEMVDTITKIMVEILNILGIATKEIRQGRTSKLLPYNRVAVDRTLLRKVSKETDRKD